MDYKKNHARGWTLSTGKYKEKLMQRKLSLLLVNTMQTINWKKNIEILSLIMYENKHMKWMWKIIYWYSCVLIEFDLNSCLVCFLYNKGKCVFNFRVIYFDFAINLYIFFFQPPNNKIVYTITNSKIAEYYFYLDSETGRIYLKQCTTGKDNRFVVIIFYCI